MKPSRIRKTRLFVTGLLAVGTFWSAPRAIAVPILWTGNGHSYELVKATGLTWQDAQQAAEGMGGYLVTITSRTENEFLRDSVMTGFRQAIWAGGWQDLAVSTTPDTGWNWVTGEAWSYTHWAPLEPNDFKGIPESYLTVNWLGDYWNDEGHDITNAKGFVVEYGAVPDSGATSAMLGGALLAIVVIFQCPCFGRVSKS